MISRDDPSRQLLPWLQNINYPGCAMSRKSINRFSVLLLLSMITACNSGPPNIVDEPGVVRLNGEQARNYVIDKTEKWPEGSIYYKPDGTLDMVWRKTKIKGTWEVMDDGNVCFNVKRWTQTCHYYVNNGGDITLIEGVKNRGVVEIVDGNHLPSR